MKVKIIIGIFILSIVTFLYSDRYAEEEEIYRYLEEIVSVASRYEQRITETPAILSILTRSQLQDMGARTISDALRFVPGLNISIDELAGYHKLSIRGVRQWANILFLIDNHRMNDFYTGLALYDLSIDYVERIEIIRGPSSSIHGTGGFVGVISIITNRDMPEGLVVKSTTGKNNTFRTSINWNKKSNDFQNNIFAEIYTTDGKRSNIYGQPGDRGSIEGRTQPHLPIEYIGPGDSKEGVESENITRQSLYNLGQTIENKEQAILDYKLAKDNINLNVKYIYDHRGPLIGLHGWKRPNTSLKRIISASSLEKTNDIFQNVSLISKLYFDRQIVEEKLQVGYNTPIEAELDYIKNFGKLGGTHVIEYEALTYGVDFQANFLTENSTIVSGIQLERLGLLRYNFTNQDGLLTNYPTRARTVKGIYFQNEYRPFDYTGLTIGFRYDDYSDFGSTFNSKIGGVWLLGRYLNNRFLQGLGLKFSYATAFRAPTFQELYDETERLMIFGSVGAPDLKPETIDTIEFAVENQYKMLRLKANFFANTINDQIGSYPGLNASVLGSANPYFNNPTKIKTKGWEFEANSIRHTFHHFFPDFWFWFNVSRVETEADEFYIYTTKMEKVNRLELPQWSLSLGINTGISNYFRFSFNFERISDRYSNTSAQVEREAKSRWYIPEFAEYNLHLYTTEELFEKITLGLKMFNITDEDTFDDPRTIGSQEVQREKRNIQVYTKIKF